jgi:hypothetical protein
LVHKRIMKYELLVFIDHLETDLLYDGLDVAGVVAPDVPYRFDHAGVLRPVDPDADHPDSVCNLYVYHLVARYISP